MIARLAKALSVLLGCPPDLFHLRARLVELFPVQACRAFVSARCRSILTIGSSSASGGSSSRSSSVRTSRIQIPHHLHCIQPLLGERSCPRRLQIASSRRLIIWGAPDRPGVARECPRGPGARSCPSAPF